MRIGRKGRITGPWTNHGLHGKIQVVICPRGKGAPLNVPGGDADRTPDANLNTPPREVGDPTRHRLPPRVPRAGGRQASSSGQEGWWRLGGQGPLGRCLWALTPEPRDRGWGRATARRGAAEDPVAPAHRRRGGSAGGGVPQRSAALGRPEAGLLHGPEPDPPPARPGAGCPPARTPGLRAPAGDQLLGDAESAPRSAWVCERVVTPAGSN